MRMLLLTLIAGASLPAADLAGGWTHSVAVDGGQVWTWGDNTYGQLGQPDAGRTLRPRRVPGLQNVVAVAASWHTLAVTEEGEVYAWGRNTYGQLGNGQCGIDAKETKPLRVAGLTGIVAVSAGWDHSLALAGDGRVYAWGSRSHGQLGDGIRKTGDPICTPTLIPGLTEIRAIAAGAYHSLALRTDGTLLAWGSNWDGQLGTGKIGNDAHSAAPVPVVASEGEGLLQNVVAIAAAGHHSVAVTADGHAYAWGYNGTGQIPIGGRGSFWGTRGRRNVTRPAPAFESEGKEALTIAAAVAAGYESTYVLTREGNVLSAGWNMYGEQGSGRLGGGNRDQLVPAVAGRNVAWPDPRPGRWRASLVYRYTDPAHAAEVTDVAVADPFVGPELVVGKETTPGTCTARISRDAEFVEAKATLLYPAQARAGDPLSCTFVQLAFGQHAGDDIATDVKLRWTEMDSGEVVDIPLLGEGEQASGPLLTPIAGLQTVASGIRHVLARDRDGAIWVWGHDGYGQLGDGAVLDRALAYKLPPFDVNAEPLPPVSVATRAYPDTTPPAGKVVNVREHGALGDGIVLDQAALQKAIDRCGSQGGGTLWFPPGVYRTGTLELRSGVRLHLSEGATIFASTNREHYPVSALVHGRDVHDVAIEGKGVVDGQGFFTGARGWRHNCLLMENCRNVLVQGVRTVNSGAWTEHYIRCIGLEIRDVTVRSLRPGRNNDGIDLSGCENVRIEGCTVISDDDAIVIKSQRPERVNRNIEVVGNTCHTYRGAFKLGTETRGEYQNLTCRDLTCYGAKALELYSVDGSETDGIEVENVTARDALVALNIRLGARLRKSYWGKEEPKVGFLRNIRIRNVDVEIGNLSWREVLLKHGIPDAELATGRPETPYDSCISGLPEHAVQNVEIEHLRARVPGGVEMVRDAKDLPERPTAYPHGGNFGTLPAYGLFIRHAENVTLRDVVFETVQPDARPPVAQWDVKDITVE